MIQVIPIHEPLSYIIKTDGEPVYNFLSANFVTLEVSCPLLPPQAQDFLTEKLREIVAAAPVISALQPAFAGIVRGLVSFRRIEPAGPFSGNIVHLEVNLAFSKESATNIQANGQSGGSYGLARVTYVFPNAQMVVGDNVAALIPVWSTTASPANIADGLGFAQFEDERTVVYGGEPGNASQAIVLGQDGNFLGYSGPSPFPFALVENPGMTRLRNGDILAAGGRLGGPTADGNPITQTLNPVTLEWTLRDTINPVLIGGVLFSNDELGTEYATYYGGELGRTIGSYANGRWVIDTLLFYANSKNSGHAVIKLPFLNKYIAIGGLPTNPDRSNGAITASCIRLEVYADGGASYNFAANMNIARSEMAAVRLPDGRVFVAGGVTTGNVLTATCEIYDPTLNTWTLKTSAPAPFKPTVSNGGVFGAHVLADGNVYIAAGNVSGAASSRVMRYNVAVNTWTMLSNMNFAREQHASTSVFGIRLIEAFGNDGGTPAPATDVGEP